MKKNEDIAVLLNLMIVASGRKLDSQTASALEKFTDDLLPSVSKKARLTLHQKAAYVVEALKYDNPEIEILQLPVTALPPTDETARLGEKRILDRWRETQIEAMCNNNLILRPITAENFFILQENAPPIMEAVEQTLFPFKRHPQFRNLSEEEVDILLPLFSNFINGATSELSLQAIFSVIRASKIPITAEQFSCHERRNNESWLRIDMPNMHAQMVKQIFRAIKLPQSLFVICKAADLPSEEVVSNENDTAILVDVQNMLNRGESAFRSLNNMAIAGAQPHSVRVC